LALGLKARLLAGHRHADEVALGDVTVEGEQQLERLGVFDTLS